MTKPIATTPALISPNIGKIGHQNKVEWVDYAKGIGIFLVVFGHTLIGLKNAHVISVSALFSSIEEFIYAFHMPLFFFISGLFVERSLRKSLLYFLQNKLKLIVYPYIIWSILQTSLQIVANQYTNQSQFGLIDILQIGYKPIMQFWFLYTLFFIFVVYALWRKVCKFPAIGFFVAAIFLYLLHGLDISFGPWGMLYLFRRHAIYFALGVAVSWWGILPRLQTIPNSQLIGTSLGGFLMALGSVRFQLVDNDWLIPAIACLGIVASVSVAILFSRYNFACFLSSWGMFSLEIFVAHSIASSVTRNLLQKAFDFSEPITHLILGTIVGIYVPIALDCCCRRLGFNYLFTLGDRKVPR